MALETGISDFHKLITAVMKTCFVKSKPKIIFYRSYKNFNETIFKHQISTALSLLRSKSMSTDFYSKYKNFSHILQTILNKHAPIKKKIVRANEVSHMTKNLRKAIMHRCKLKKIYNCIPNINNWENYKKQRNYLCRFKQKM